MVRSAVDQTADASDVLLRRIKDGIHVTRCSHYLMPDHRDASHEHVVDLGAVEILGLTSGVLDQAKAPPFSNREGVVVAFFRRLRGRRRPIETSGLIVPDHETK